MATCSILFITYNYPLYTRTVEDACPYIKKTCVTIKTNCHPERVKRVELFLSGSPKIGDFWGYKEKRKPLGEAGSRLVGLLQFDCLFASPYLKEIPFWVSPKTHFLRKMFDFGKQFYDCFPTLRMTQQFSFIKSAEPSA